MPNNEKVEIQEEDISQSNDHGENQNTKIEERARQKGWKPLSEFDGEEVNFVDAKEFLSREPLLETIRDLKKHIKTQRENTDRDMQLISTQFAQMSEQAYKRALIDLESQRDLAIEDKNTDALKKIDTEIDTLKEDRRKQADVVKQVETQRKQHSQEPTPEMKEWLESNTWFNQDQEMQDEAVAIGVGYLAKNPNKTQSQMLKHVTDRIKKIYPEKFTKRKISEDDEDMDDQNSLRVEKSNPSPKLGGNNRSKKLTVNDLNDQEKEIMKTLVKRGVFKKLAIKNKRSEQDEYLAQLGEGKGL